MHILSEEIIIINTSMPLKNYMKRRPTHYAEILAKHNRVINLSTSSLKNALKHKSKVPWEEKIFYRLPGTKFKVIQWINQKRFNRFANKLIKKLSQKPILWHFYSGNSEIVRSLPNKLSILEICDDTPEFFSDTPGIYQRVKRNEDIMTKSVDIVFTISDYLKQKKINIRPDIQVVRNGVVFEDFSKVPSLPKNPTDELYHFSRPIVGYVGAISKWFDFNLIDKIAQKLPDINFVFVGRITPMETKDTETLNKMKNVFFIGERPYGALPHYLKYFELAHIPFIMNELVASVNPIKLYEYLAAGLRVISTPLPEVKLYEKKNIIEIAIDEHDYIYLLSSMLKMDKLSVIYKCQNLAKINTWEERVKFASLKIFEGLRQRSEQ